MKWNILLIVLGILIAGAVGSVGGYYYGKYVYYSPVNARDVRVQYYRGVYDMCRAGLRMSSTDCLVGIEKTKEHKWYESDSSGWIWNDNQNGVAP